MRIRLSNGLAMGYRSSGQGRVIVFLHPVGTGAWFWSSTAEILADRYRSISIDMRGYGDSDTPTVKFSLDDLAGDVIEMLRAQEIKEAVVVGCSMGGMVAQGMVLAAPDLFSGVVLTGTISTQTPDRIHIPLGRAEEALGGMPPLVEDTIGRWFPADMLVAGSPVIDRTREELLSLDPVVFAWSWLAIAGLAYGDRLREVTVPALLVRGTEDAAGRTMPQMAEIMPRGKFVEMPGAGHMAPMEQPEAFAALLHDFIATEIGG